VPERAVVSSYGGRMAIVGDPKGHATRDLVARIRATVTIDDQRPTTNDQRPMTND